MDFEALVFKLKPLIQSEPLDYTLVQGEHFEVFDELAVSLRSPSNRELLGSSGLLLDLISILRKALENFFVKKYKDDNWLELSSALTRCVANSLADNDNNRKIFIEQDNLNENAVLSKYIPHLFALKGCDKPDLCASLHRHTAALVKNLFMENEEYIDKYGLKIQETLLPFVQNLLCVEKPEFETVDIVSELFVDFLEVRTVPNTLQEMGVLSSLIMKTSSDLKDFEGARTYENTEEEVAEDEIIHVGILLNLSRCLEIIITKNSDTWESSSFIHIQGIEKSLFEALAELNALHFPNKLIIMRRLTVPFGYLSTIKFHSNVSEQALCIEMLSKYEKNGYITSCALLVLSNSIESRKDVDELNEKISIKQLISLAQFFEDPIQYQGYLDILKKLLNLSSVILLEKDDLTTLCSVLERCYDKSQIFKQLLPLLSVLLQKLLVTLTSSSIHFLLSSENSKLLQIILENDSVFSCLALDKLLVSRRETSPKVLEKLWDSAFEFRGSSLSDNRTNHIPPFNLFQLAKSVGVYLKCYEGLNTSLDTNMLFQRYIENVQSLLDTIHALEASDDKANKAVYNNGQFIAGMIINILATQHEINPELERLLERCHSFFGQK